MTDTKQKGFTIIEIMIVLAIAGLILLIVIMTIPTLQRNGRNNQRSQDVTAMLQVTSSWGLNHSGEFPSDTPPSTTKKDAVLAQTKRTFYTDNSSIIITGRNNDSYLTAPVSPVTDTETVQIMNYARCSTTAVGNVVGQGAGYDNVVALYALETRTGTTSQCQQL